MNVKLHMYMLTGSNLPVCSTDNLQCCSREYVDDVTQRARQYLMDGLREEFQNRIEDYERIVQQLMQCECDFITV